jgi:hypothetical protein
LSVDRPRRGFTAALARAAIAALPGYVAPSDRRRHGAVCFAHGANVFPKWVKAQGRMSFEKLEDTTKPRLKK